METPKDSVYDKDIEANHYQTLAEALNHVNGVGYRDTVELSAIPSMKNIKRIEIKGERDETTFDVNIGSWHQRNYEMTNQGLRGDFGWFITGGVHENNLFDFL